MRRTQLLAAIGVIVGSAALAAASWAFFTAAGSAQGAAAVGAFGPPTGVAATVPDSTVRTVHVTWTAPSTPDSSAVSGYTVSRSNGSTTTAACGTGTSALAGTATSCDDTNVPSASYTYTVTAQWKTWTATSAASGSVTVAASALHHFTVSPSTSTPAAGTSFSVTLTAIDQYGATFSAYSGTKTVAWSALSTSPAPASQSPSYPTTSVAFSSGVSTTTLTATAYAAGSNALTVTESSKSGSASLTVGVAGASKLVFTTQPTNTVSTSSISPLPAVAVHDAYDNLVAGDTSSVTLAIGTNPGSGTLSGTTTVAASSGSATFTGLSIDKAGTGYTLTATDGSLTAATSSTFNITVGAPTKLAFTQQPGGATAANGVFPTQPVVAAQDAGGNTVTSYTTAVTLTLTTNPGGATLAGCSATTTSGVASFTGCKLSKTGVGYVITASSGSLTSAASNPFNVTAAASKLVFTTQPGGGITNTAWSQQPVVSVQDTNSNVVTAYPASSVALAITSGTGASGAALTCNATTVSTSYGVATFGGCAIDLASASNYTLRATSGSLTAGTSAGFSVTGPATKLSVTTQPSSGSVAGSAFSTQPVVTVQDASGITVTSYTTPVTLAITAGTGQSGAVLSCTSNPVTPSFGVATFAGCAVDRWGTGYTLTATSGSLTAGISSSFDVYQNAPALGLTNKVGGTQGRPEAGDTIVITYPDPIAASTLCGGWSGSTTLTHVTVSFTNSGGDQVTGITDTSDCTGTTGFRAAAGLGAIALNTTGKYFTSAGNFANGSATWNSSTNTMTVTLGATLTGTVGNGASATGTYTPDTSLSVPAGATFTTTAGIKQF